MFPLVLSFISLLEASICGAKLVSLDDTSSQLSFSNCHTGNSNGCGGSDCLDLDKLFHGTWRDCSLANSAVLTFSFTGTAVQIIGVIPGSDGFTKTPKPMVFEVDGTEYPASDLSSLAPHTYNVTYCQKSGLSHGTHQVSVSAGSPEDDKNTYILIDYVVYDDGNNPAASTSSAAPAITVTSHDTVTKSDSATYSAASSDQSTSSKSASPGVSTTTTLIFNTQTSPNADSSTPTTSTNQSYPSQSAAITSTRQRSNVGAIVGAICGVLFIAFIFCVILFIIRRRRQMLGDKLLPDAFVEQKKPSFEDSDGLQIPEMQASIETDPPPYGSPRVAREMDTPLAAFCEEHRDLISPFLEMSLRTAGYHPTLDPDIISRESWAEAGVGAFSLQILRDLYQRSNPSAASGSSSASQTLSEKTASTL